MLAEHCCQSLITSCSWLLPLHKKTESFSHSTKVAAMNMFFKHWCYAFRWCCIHCPVRMHTVYEFLIFFLFTSSNFDNKMWLWGFGLGLEWLVSNIKWRKPAIFHFNFCFSFRQKCHVGCDNNCRQHNNEVELLFHMLRCYTARYIPQFQFFKEFLDETVSQVRNLLISDA